MGPNAPPKKKRVFDPHGFLATMGEGRKLVRFRKKQTIFAQRDPSDAVFYIHEGRVRLIVLSGSGKEATIRRAAVLSTERQRPS